MKRNRFMRIIVFFDMPITTPAERKAYARFRKSLIKDGYLMLQESVYVKLAIDRSAAEQITTRLKAMSPSNGIIQVLIVTERQFQSIIDINDSQVEHSEIDSTESLVIV